jgi:isopenicillin-N epimerase
MDAPSPLATPIASRDEWLLDPEIAFLNHGSFGARLRRVVGAQRSYQDRFEAQPLGFLDREGPALLRTARDRIGRFLGAGPDDLGFCSNATEAVSTVLRSLQFEPGDEVMTTDHVYNGVRQAVRHILADSGAVLREVEVAVPASAASIEESLIAALSPRCRLVLVSHVTSPTALRFPVERIAAACAKRGIDVLVDGAHAPGMLDLDIGALGVPFYAANLHKWLGAPMGAGLLWVDPARQREVHPHVVSHNVGQGFAAEFEWQGSRDIAPWLAAADAIEIASQLAADGGWPALRSHNHALARWVQAHLCERWNVEPLSSLDGDLLGSMASVRLPPRARERFDSPEAFVGALRASTAVEVPCFDWRGTWLIRPCCHVYNRAEEYERLADTILELVD